MGSSAAPTLCATPAPLPAGCPGAHPRRRRRLPRSRSRRRQRSPPHRRGGRRRRLLMSRHAPPGALVGLRRRPIPGRSGMSRTGVPHGRAARPLCRRAPSLPIAAPLSPPPPPGQPQHMPLSQARRRRVILHVLGEVHGGDRGMARALPQSDCARSKPCDRTTRIPCSRQS